MNTVTAKSIVEARAKAYAAFIREGNAAEIAAFHTKNVRLLPPGSDIVQGRVAVQSYFQMLFDNGVKDMRFETIDAEFLGENMIREINLSLTTIRLPDGTEQERKSKAVIAWQKEDGEFKVAIDIWNN